MNSGLLVGRTDEKRNCDVEGMDVRAMVVCRRGARVSRLACMLSFSHVCPHTLSRPSVQWEWKTFVVAYTRHACPTVILLRRYSST
ncbi:hypothetical protein DOTSEDRAFT_74477 [Dothistroma septosporum NZE10]|uniref:Uncharacterized protein n=1 Tax=Dothistroma septosporum (strain NZE10 / CBS 128990) TaxID=675120 RepID=N1PHA1_DOTSN|nr:hypothetical protein DOTSEDRAFT_74477 [Dothistroma septosporum NZE10]